MSRFCAKIEYTVRNGRILIKSDTVSSNAFGKATADRYGRILVLAR